MTAPSFPAHFERRVAATVQDVGNAIIGLSQSIKARPLTVAQEFQSLI